MTPAKALLFPSAVEALGSRGAGMSTEVWWSHHDPFKSGLTGETAQQFCDAYEAATGKQWTQPIGFQHAIFEVAIDALKRAKKLDPAAIRDAIAATDYDSSSARFDLEGVGLPTRCRMCALRRSLVGSGKKARSSNTIWTLCSTRRCR